MNIRLSPALIALLLGCAAWILILIGHEIASHYLKIRLATVYLILIQGVLAALLARVFGLKIWWQWILLLFTIAVWLALKLNPNPNLVFGGFLLFVFMYWSVFLTQVPYYPSSKEVCIAVANLMQGNEKLRVIEIGSGLGGFSLQLAKLHPESTYVGIEIAPLPYLISIIRAKYQQSIVIFKLGSYKKLDLGQFDLVFAYLSPAAMPQLHEQCKMQMRPGTILVSHEFAVLDATPTKIVCSTGSSKSTYVYAMG